LVYLRAGILREQRPLVKEKCPKSPSPAIQTVGKGKKAMDGVWGARVELVGAACASSG
jgi:hypothetical protein